MSTKAGRKAQKDGAAQARRKAEQKSGGNAYYPSPAPLPPSPSNPYPSTPVRTNGMIYNQTFGRRRGMRSYSNESGLDAASIKYINAVCNPFGTDEKGVDHIDKNSGVTVPTGERTHTIPMTIYRTCTLVCADGYHYLINPCVATSDKAISIDEVHAVDSVALSPTAGTVLLDGTSDANWFASTLVSNVRIVAFGLKCNPISPPDVTGGMLKGTSGDSTSVYTTLRSAYSTFAATTDTMDPQTYSAGEGITVRYDPTGSDNVLSANNNFAAPAPISIGSFRYVPRIEILSPTAGTTFKVDLVAYLECMPADRSNCPLGQSPAAVSNDFQKVIRLLSNRQLLPVVAHGHSFKDFISGVGKFFKGVGSAALKTLQDPAKLAQIASLAKMITGFVV